MSRRPKNICQTLSNKDKQIRMELGIVLRQANYSVCYNDSGLVGDVICLQHGKVENYTLLAPTSGNCPLGCFNTTPVL